MKKKHPEHVNLERWLVSYADFITLLFAFFVVMYAISQADMNKLKRLAESMRAAFGPPGSAGVIDLQGRSGGDTAAPLEQEEAPGGRVLNLPAGKANTAADQDEVLQNLRDKLEQTITLELGVSALSEDMKLFYDSRGLVLRLAATDFFDEGSAEIRGDLRPLLDRIGKLLALTPKHVRIEGHADAHEKPGSFSSLWELSTARASWVAKYWLKRFDFDPKRLSVAGYAGYRPLGKGDGQWSQARNRRIEIIILNNELQP